MSAFSRRLSSTLRTRSGSTCGEALGRGRVRARTPGRAIREGDHRVAHDRHQVVPPGRRPRPVAEPLQLEQLRRPCASISATFRSSRVRRSPSSAQSASATRMRVSGERSSWLTSSRSWSRDRTISRTRPTIRLKASVSTPSSSSPRRGTATSRSPARDRGDAVGGASRSGAAPGAGSREPRTTSSTITHEQAPPPAGRAPVRTCW